MHDLRHDPDAKPDAKSNSVQPAADHDCTPWTERIEKRLAQLEDAINRQADTLQYLLLKLGDDGK